MVAEERPRTALTQSFSKLFKDLGLHPRAVSTSFGCRVNLAICLQVGARLSAPARSVWSRSAWKLWILGTGLDDRKFSVDLDLLIHADLGFLVF